MKRAALIIACASLFACGSESTDPKDQSPVDGGIPSADAGARTDAGVEPTDAGTGPEDAGTTPEDGGSPSAECGVETNLGTIDTFNSTGCYYDTDESGYWIQGNFGFNDDPDVVTLELNEKAGAFSGKPAVGTYEIKGDDLNYATCGLCVLLYGDFLDPDGPTYLATGGSVTLTSVDGRLTGTLDNVTFQHVTIDQSTYVSTSVDDGCKPRITRLTFDDALYPAR